MVGEGLEGLRVGDINPQICGFHIGHIVHIGHIGRFHKGHIGHPPVKTNALASVEARFLDFLRFSF